MPQNPTEFSSFITWGFYGMATLMGGVLLRFFYQLKTSVQAMSINLAVGLEKIGAHDKAIDRHDGRFSEGDKRFASIERELNELRGAQGHGGRKAR